MYYLNKFENKKKIKLSPFKSGGGQKGVSLYFAIIILSILLAIVLGLGTILVGQTRMIKGMGDSVVAFYGADTGIERILYEDKLCRQSGCDGLTWPCVDTFDCDEGRSNIDSPVSGSVGQATYQVTFDNGATNITSIGMYSGTRRAIQVSR